MSDLVIPTRITVSKKQVLGTTSKTDMISVTFTEPSRKSVLHTTVALKEEQAKELAEKILTLFK